MAFFSIAKRGATGQWGGNGACSRRRSSHRHSERKAVQSLLSRRRQLPAVPFEATNPFGITMSDPDHSDAEQRWLDIGLSAEGRVLVVWYTERGENIRVIGCRKATKSEQGAYAR